MVTKKERALAVCLAIASLMVLSFLGSSLGVIAGDSPVLQLHHREKPETPQLKKYSA